MESEKKYFAGWWVWVLLLCIITGVVLTLLSYFGLIGKTIVERKVFENSYQYSEARKTESLTFRAQLAQIETKLTDPALDQSTRTNLEAQAAALRVQIQVSEGR